MDSVSVTIFNQLLGQYNGSILAIQSASIDIAKELFNAIAVVSVAVLGIHRLLSRQIDMVESNIELIKLLIYMNVFYLFIVQYDQFLPMIINSFRAAGIYMGSKVSGYAIPTNPGDIINTGLSIASKILNISKNHQSLANLGLTLIAVIAAGVVLYCFGIIAIELILIDIGSRIILAGGIFLLAFVGSAWTREYAQHYVHTFFHLGVKMLFVYILIGLGAGLTQTWVPLLDNIKAGQIIEYYVAIIMATFVYYKLCQKLPDQAVSFFTGRSSLNFETATSLGAMATKIHQGFTMTQKKVQEISDGVKGQVASFQGNQQAMAAARQSVIANFTAQGKTVTDTEIQREAVKTLGEAKEQFKKDLWGKVVDDTPGGKVSKQIIDAMPKPEKPPKKRVIRKSKEITGKDYLVNT